MWSPLEYAAHVRDVYAIMGDRAELMLTEQEPTFPNWDQDATALEKRYWETDPVVVAAEIGAAAERTAGVFAAVRPEQWDRMGYLQRGNATVVESGRLVQKTLHSGDTRRWDTGRQPGGRLGPVTVGQVVDERGDGSDGPRAQARRQHEICQLVPVDHDLDLLAGGRSAHVSILLGLAAPR